MQILSIDHFPKIPRLVIRVLENPREPEFLDEVPVDPGRPHGETHLVPHTAPAPPGTDPAAKTGEWCQSCRSNWRIQEHVWTGAELFTQRVKTQEELLDELRERMAPQAPPEDQVVPAGILDLAGTDL